MNITPAELAALLHEATEPLRRELASALDHATAEHKRATSLERILNSAESALDEKDAELEKVREVVTSQAMDGWKDRSNLSKQLDAATKRAVQAEEALAAEQAAHAKTKARVPNAPQVGGTIDLEFGDWVQDSSGEFSPVYLNDEKLEPTDVCVVRGTGPNARIIWVAGGES